MCTLRNFPFLIEHCIEWSRDLFVGWFEDAPKELETYIKNPTEFVNEVAKERNPSMRREKLENIKKLLNVKNQGTFDACIAQARTEY